MRKILDNKIFKAIKFIFKFIIITVLVLYVLFLAVQRFSNNSSIMGYRVFTIATGSMEPVYKVSDVILVKEVGFDNLSVDDDITYMGKVGDFKDKIVTHRIKEIDKDKGTLITQGVANEFQDPEVNKDQVLGKVERKLVLFSFLTGLTRNKVGFYFLIFVPLVLVIFLEVADLFTKDKDEDDDDEEKETEDDK